MGGVRNNFRGYGMQGNQPLRVMRDYMQPTFTSYTSCIILPTNEHPFDLKPGVIELLPKFHGLDSENPYLHLKDFEEICNNLNKQNISEDFIKLKLFTFSLKEKAKTWFYSLRPSSISTWEEMEKQFLKKFFPTHKTIALKQQIMNFFQKENEAFYQCWERFNDLLNCCPHHGYETWHTIGFFYEGLNFDMRQLVEIMCNGEFLDKIPEEAWDYLNKLADDSKSWDYVESFEELSEINLKTMNVKKIESVLNVEAIHDVCDFCETVGHTIDDCSILIDEMSHSQSRITNINYFGWEDYSKFNLKDVPVKNPQESFNCAPNVRSHENNLEETLQI